MFRPSKEEEEEEYEEEFDEDWSSENDTNEEEDDEFQDKIINSRYCNRPNGGLCLYTTTYTQPCINEFHFYYYYYFCVYVSVRYSENRRTKGSHVCKELNI